MSNVPPIINVPADLVISEQQFAEFSEVTNAEQIIKLKCWDIQEYINKIQEAQQKLDEDLDKAKKQLQEATSELEQSRVKLKIAYDNLFAPMGLENKTISISQTPPHRISILGDQPEQE